MIETIGLIIGSLTLLLMIVGGFLQRKHEKKRWNKGKCSCGGSWKNFDTDSQGGRGYNCDSCDASVWISYKVDRRKGRLL